MYKILHKVLYFFYYLLIFFISGCKVKTDHESEESSLRKRLNEFLEVSAAMKYDSTLAYIYPKVFEIIPRYKLKESKEESYQFIKGKAKIDSFRIDTLYPVLHVNKGSYALALYSMVMEIPIDSTDNVSGKIYPNKAGTSHSIDTNLYPAPPSTLMATLSRGLGIEITSLIEANGVRRFRMVLFTICAKDKYSKDWSFYTVIGNDTIAQKLFPKKVLEQFESYNK